jgi:hypothetical protein
LELGDGGAASAQLVKKLDAHRRGEYPEALGDQVRKQVRKGVWERRLLAMSYITTQMHSCVVL